MPEQDGYTMSFSLNFENAPVFMSKGNEQKK
jgi:hypothetical protein